MDIITQQELANYENVAPPETEKSNFLYSFTLLPKEERSAIHSVYAFCSYIDDIVDSTPTPSQAAAEYKMQRLEWWERELEKIYDGRLRSPLLRPFQKVIQRFDIPRQYFTTLIDGCRRDLMQNRYETFEELKEYCYSVASVVGLISIEIFGYKYEETKNYAVNLGYALKLTNILRDIKIDKDRGYIYMPQEDMRRFGYSEEDLINEVYNENFVELMRFQTRRVREYYHKARTSLRPDERQNILAAEVMDAIYYRLLEKIELNDFNVFKRKIRVSRMHKLMITLKHWLSIGMFVKRLKKHKR
ncbi:MAG: presqualene diphosphate synthase HpnD [Candidatus Kapaibacterium sp.]